MEWLACSHILIPLKTIQGGKENGKLKKQLQQ